MSWILSMALGTCVIIVVGGTVIGVWMLLIGRMEAGERHAKSGARGVDLDKRVAELERRLTDTQDIVISLSEKLEHSQAADAVFPGDR